MSTNADQVQELIKDAVLRDAGTSGSIPYLDSNKKLAQDNSNLFYDATNGRVGIGTVSPTNKLHVAVGLGASLEVAHLSQSTVTLPVLRISGHSEADVLTQTLVAGASVTTATKAAFVRVAVQDDNSVVAAGNYYIQLFTIT